MQGGGGRDEVWRVAVVQQSSGAQGERSTAAVQGGGRRHGLRVRLEHGCLLGLLVLAGHFPVAGLDAFFLHGEGPVDLGEASVKTLHFGTRFPAALEEPSHSRCAV